MYIAEYNGINSVLIGLAKLLLESGVQRNTRGEKCIELPAPICIKITNPQSRIITIPERKWNVFLPYAESLWIASGRNDLAFIKYYLPKMARFSDDNEYIRGGYGPRIRFYNNDENDYKKSSFLKSKNIKEIDQFQYIENSFKRDPFTRQGVIEIGDPIKDCFDLDGSLKNTKDLPCTRSLNFIRCSHTNKLDLTVYMRSNDFIWGMTGVNMFNYMFMQEYFSAILGLEVGCYYHIVNNFHYYPDKHQKLVESLASLDNVSDESYNYTKTFTSLYKFDMLLGKLGK